jgi:hypothetical protein
MLNITSETLNSIPSYLFSLFSLECTFFRMCYVEQKPSSITVPLTSFEYGTPIKRRLICLCLLNYL